MSQQAVSGRRTQRGDGLPSLWLLWLGIASGPVAWMAQLSLEYLLVTLECSESGGNLLGPRAALDVALGAVCLLSAVVSGWCYRMANAAPEGPRRERCRFMAASGIVLSVLFFAGVLLASIPQGFLETCNAR
jgi:hypothetical protein